MIEQGDAPGVTGIEELVFGVDDLSAARRFLTLYGLSEVDETADRSRWEALDGSAIVVRHREDGALPPPVIAGSTGRLYIWGVRDQAALDLIAGELSRDREVRTDNGGLLISTDDDGHAIAFRITQRRRYEAAMPAVNVTGAVPGRAINARVDFETPPRARAMGHVVFWSSDPERSAAFYRDRLGFRLADAVAGNQGMLLRSDGHHDHHSIFFLNIGRTPFKPSLQHVEFQFSDLHEVMIGGDRLTRAGYRTVFGPGRHVLGSNWYWYFDSPLGCAFELAADMDRADDRWEARVWDKLDDVKGWAMAYGAAGPSASIEADRRG